MGMERRGMKRNVRKVLTTAWVTSCNNVIECPISEKGTVNGGIDEAYESID